MTTPDTEHTVLSNAAIRWGATIIAVLGIGLAVALLLLYGGTEGDRSKLGPVNFTSAVFRHDTGFDNVELAGGAILTDAVFRQGQPAELEPPSAP